mmetsp:Transcript_2301/g.6601  ORF Transcript_2301/g.6601 Transcript_2301/m.6601 type:complete len:236 (+) Transcript_2301:653-1360(+)
MGAAIRPDFRRSRHDGALEQAPPEYRHGVGVPRHRHTVAAEVRERNRHAMQHGPQGVVNDVRVFQSTNVLRSVGVDEYHVPRQLLVFPRQVPEIGGAFVCTQRQVLHIQCPHRAPVPPLGHGTGAVDARALLHEHQVHAPRDAAAECLVHPVQRLRAVAQHERELRRTAWEAPRPPSPARLSDAVQAGLQRPVAHIRRQEQPALRGALHAHRVRQGPLGCGFGWLQGGTLLHLQQ